MSAGDLQASKEDEMENDENQADIEEGKDVEGIKKEVKEADEVDKDKQVVRTQFLEEREREEQNSQVVFRNMTWKTKAINQGFSNASCWVAMSLMCQPCCNCLFQVEGHKSLKKVFVHHEYLCL